MIEQSVLPTISSNTSLPSPIKKKDKKDGGGGESAKSSPPSGRKLLPSASLSKPGLNKEVGNSSLVLTLMFFFRSYLKYQVP